jgi:hypothetical protein
MAFIISILLPLRLSMLFLSLRQRYQRLGEYGCKDSADCNGFKLRHALNPPAEPKSLPEGVMRTQETRGASLREFDMWVVN